jgi:ubiquinone/menaquinone biosynthesis C-methylase UbiE
LNTKQRVKQYWQKEPCGTRTSSASERSRFFQEIEEKRYLWEPYIRPFARFECGKGLRVLEIGVGAGTDFANWIRGGAQAFGLDLTTEAVQLTRERLELEGRSAPLHVGDAENLALRDATFDVVYSYGVLHHSPKFHRAVEEVERVLKPGGKALIMVYHAYSWVGILLWVAHCLLKLTPWKSTKWAIENYLESPGTQSFSVSEARTYFRRFRKVTIRTQLSHGDLLKMPASSKYRAWIHKLAWACYPRWLIRLTGNRFGLAMLIEAIR